MRFVAIFVLLCNLSKAAVISSKSCSDLGWLNADLYGNSTVCGGSIFDRGRCAELLTWPQADAFCTSPGARLCTSSELSNNEAKSTGCGLDATLVWTSTAANCVEGSYEQIFGAHSSVDSLRCAVASSTANVRCCADVVASGSLEIPGTSSSPSPNFLNPQNIAAVAGASIVCLILVIILSFCIIRSLRTVPIEPKDKALDPETLPPTTIIGIASAPAEDGKQTETSADIESADKFSEAESVALTLSKYMAYTKKVRSLERNDEDGSEESKGDSSRRDHSDSHINISSASSCLSEERQCGV